MAVNRRIQRGAALLLAMMIVALVATLATAMVWQQWRAVQIESIERARSQASWILNGALDWSRLILKEDRARAVDHLGEVWAVPLAEARLSTFLAADKNNTDGGPEAFLSGSIVDAQARFNVRNLIALQNNKMEPVKAQVDAFTRLCVILNVDPGAATAIAAAMAQAYATTPDATARLEPHSVDQLAWLGIDASTLAKLAPYVVVLPVADTKLNINTASREVIAAVADIAVSSADLLVRSRPFKDLQAADAATKIVPTQQALLAVTTNYFEVRGRLRLDRRVIEETSLMLRTPTETKAVSRNRESLRELPG